MSRTQGNRRGFTLIELLVVIAIIAILAAILFPVFARAREQARAATCLSNSRQLGTAIQMYLQDYDGSFPTMYWDAGIAAGDTYGELYGGHSGIGNATQLAYATTSSYLAQLNPYTKNNGVGVCPSDSGAKATPTIGQRFTSYHYRHYLSYGFAQGYSGDPNVKGKVWREPDFGYPADTYVIHEMWPWHDNRVTPTAIPWCGAVGWEPGAKMTFTFMDGHAKAVSVDKLVLKANWWPGQCYDYHWPTLGENRDQK